MPPELAAYCRVKLIVRGIIRELKGEIDHWNVTDLPTLRATSASALESALCAAGISDGPSSSVTRFESPAEAFQDALNRASEGGRILVFGSFSTVAGVVGYRQSERH
jgi:dihydrofolate synthase/folylpolyglutamate synthase